MASYLAYPEYSPDGYPASWEQKRLRFALKMNPSKSEIDLEDSDLVSFVPMDAVGEYGGIRLNEEIELSEIGSGYTYFCDHDVVVAKITPCFENGKGALATGLKNKTAFGTTELHVMRANREQLEPQFLFYLTISDLFRKIGESEMYGAGGQKRVPESFIKDFRAGLPSVREQQAIARFLDFKTAQIDVLIAKKKALLDKLAEKRTALISHAVTKGLDPSVPMKDSGVTWLGDIPAHWNMSRVRFAIEALEQGWSPQCNNDPADDEQWGVMKVGCVNGEEFDATENKALPDDLLPLTQYELKRGDILVSRANTKELLGSAALVRSVRPRLLLCDKLYRMRAMPVIEPEYLVRFLRSSIARYHYERHATGASGSMQNIGQDTLKSLPLPLPPRSEQNSIANYIDSIALKISTQIEAVELVIEKLKEYRSALITNAVTGKIDVRGFEVPQSAEGIAP